MVAESMINHSNGGCKPNLPGVTDEVIVLSWKNRMKQNKSYGNISSLSEPKSHLWLWSCRLQGPADENCDPITMYNTFTFNLMLK